MPVPINFSHRTLQRGVAQPAAVFQSPIVPRTLPLVRIPVGTTVDFTQIAQALAVNQPPPLPSQFGDLHAVVQDQWVGPRRLGVLECASPFGLWLRTVEMPQVDGTSWYLSVLAAVPATSGHWPSAEKRQRADVVAVSYGSDPLLLGGIRVFHSGSRYGVEYAARNPDTGAFDRRRATVVDGPAVFDRTHDARLVSGCAQFLNCVQLREAAATVLARIHEDFAPDQALVGRVREIMWRDIMSPVVLDMYLLLQSDSRRARVAGSHPQALHVLGERFSDSPWRLGEEETVLLEDACVRMDRAHAQHLSGVSLHVEEVDAAVSVDDLSSSDRTAAFRELFAQCERHLRNADGLFCLIPFLNECAGSCGFDDYAEWRLQEQFGCSLDDFFQCAKSYFDATAGKTREFLELLRTIRQRENPQETVPIQLSDITHLRKQWMQQQGVPQPSLLTAAQALAATRHLLRDLGFDTARAPWSRVVIDSGEREGKPYGAPQAMVLDGEQSFFSFRHPEAGYDPEALAVLTHEYVHALHMQAAQGHAGGFVQIKDAMMQVPRDWQEGVAVLVERLWDHPQIAARYLGRYPGYTESYFEALGTFQHLFRPWQTRGDFLIALQEIMLYREELPGSDDPTPFEDRLRLWHEWVPRYLFVETDPSVAVGEWALKPHVATSDLLLSYAAYPMGVVRTQPLFDRHIRRGTTRELRRLGADLRRLFRKGSMVTPADLTAVGLRLPVAT